MLFSKESEWIQTFRISENFLDFQVVDFFSFLRFLIYDGDIRAIVKKIYDNKKLDQEGASYSFYLISPIDKETEIKLIKMIREIMLINMNKYKTTLDEDEGILIADKKGEKKLLDNERNCILMRVCEKRILKFYMRFAEYCLELYEMSEKVIYIYIDI